MPSDVLTRKALSLVRCLDRIRLKTPPTAAALKGDLDLQGAARRAQARIGEATQALAQA